MGEILGPDEKDLLGPDHQAERRETSSVYDGSELQSILNVQRERSGETMALFTDIDDSFYLPDDPTATQQLFNELKGKDIPVVAVTGNQIQVVEERIARADLPHFQAICSSVGSQIWVLTPDPKTGNPRYSLDQAYLEKVVATGFDRKKIVEIAKEEIKKSAQEDPTSKLNFQWPEEEEFYNGQPCLANQEYKVSLQFESDLEQMIQIRDRFIQLFSDFKVSVCQIKEIGGGKNFYYLDILAADKADAINYLCDTLRVDIGMVAGDSGNDITMLSGTGNNVHSVLVGSYKPEAKKAVDEMTSHPEATGRGSFRRVPTRDGSKLFYTERHGLKGPHSIRRAAEILRRASVIAKIKVAREGVLNKEGVNRKEEV